MEWLKIIVFQIKSGIQIADSIVIMEPFSMWDMFISVFVFAAIVPLLGHLINNMVRKGGSDE